jgi:hypothetical protein
LRALQLAIIFKQLILLFEQLVLIFKQALQASSAAGPILKTQRFKGK